LTALQSCGRLVVVASCSVAQGKSDAAL
jgi:hypothetical protein